MTSDDVDTKRVSTDLLENLIRRVHVDELSTREFPWDHDIGQATVRDSVFGKLSLPVVRDGEVVWNADVVEAERIDPKDQGEVVVIDITELDWDANRADLYALGEYTAAKNLLVNHQDLADMVLRLAEWDRTATEMIGWDDAEIQGLLEQLEQTTSDAQNEYDGIDRKAPNHRNLPLDVIYTLTPTNVTSFVAADCGWMIGVQSTITMPPRERWAWKFEIGFVDNEFKDYDHDAHVRFVADLDERPKYATVRDYMDADSCRIAGIEHFEFDEILGFADDMAQYADNVIVIPKVADCIDDIPPDYVLGFSVKSSYGMTPVPAEAFRGRRVHLLGGTWADQRAYLGLLGDDVVSIDTNLVYKASMWGTWYDEAGNSKDVYDIGVNPVNGSTVAVALSLGNISRDIRKILGEDPDPPINQWDGAALADTYRTMQRPEGPPDDDGT